MILKQSVFFVALSFCVLLVAVPVQADDKDARIEAMERQMQMMMQELQTLKAERAVEKAEHAALVKQVSDLRNSAQALADISPAAGQSQDGVKISMNPMPKIESQDGAYSFQPFGRIHMDVTHFDDDAFDHASNANFRRARLGFKGNLGEDFKYKSEFDFAEEAVNFKEVSLTYTGLDSADVKVGHQKPSFGMEQNTSANYLMFIERAAPTNAFTRDEEIGLNVLAGGDQWSLGAGIFNEDAGNDDTGEDEDITYDIRGSVNLLGLTDDNNDSDVLHVGAGYSHRRPTGNVRFNAKPAGDGNNIIDTGNIGSVDDVSVYSAEIAAIFGPFSLQSEYFMADLSRSGGNADADFDGYYAQAGWFLTGESRPYKGSAGNFGRVKPLRSFDLKTGDWGAWEILARVENTNLNDGGITGGELDNYSLGLNWYLTDYVRVMANVIDVDTDSNAVTANDDPMVYNARVQWDF